MMTRTLTAGVLMVSLLGGCFDEPPERSPECFLEGGVVVDANQKSQLDIDIDRDSDFCCAENRDCISLFEANDVEIAGLGQCSPARRGNGGVCALDCRLGENCECRTNSDCLREDPEDQTSVARTCTVGSKSECVFAAQDESKANSGFTVSDVSDRCSYCAQCLSDDDCGDREGRPHCANGVCAQCVSNGDCSEAGTSICAQGACVECGDSNDCADGESCKDDNTCG
jgi:hypothetical protein